MNDPKGSRVGVAELKARLSSYLRAARRGETVTVYDRDTPVARLVPYEGWVQGTLHVRKAATALRDVKLPAPLGRDIDSMTALQTSGSRGFPDTSRDAGRDPSLDSAAVARGCGRSPDSHDA